MNERSRMHVTVVGELSRASVFWERAARGLGITVEHHVGSTHGRGVDAITAAVRRSDVVVIITEPNSHGGVATARRASVAFGRPHVLIKRLRPDRLADVIAEATAAARPPIAS